MNIRNILALLLGFILSAITVAQGQARLFDIVSYSPPAGWQNEEQPFATSWTATDQSTGGWCRMTIYRSAQSSGDPKKDFIEEWRSIIAGAYPVTAEPRPEQTGGGGWTLNSGTANFQFSGRNSLAALYTFSGYGLKVSLVYLANTDAFQSAFEGLWGSIDLQEPTTQPQKINQAEPQRVQQVPQSPAFPSSGSIVQSISYATTNFDDGWSSVIFPDFVRVTRGQTNVILHHGVVLDDALRQGDSSENLFNMLVPTAYQVSDFRRVMVQEGCMFMCDSYLAADVVERATGKRSHMVFTVVTNAGVARCIEVHTPTPEVFRTEFPDPNRISVMLYYNRFAITLQDIIGNWKGGSSSAMDMVYTGTGTYAGMNTAVLSDEFIIGRDGTYTSRHAGAVGMVGNMSFNDSRYSGKALAGMWDLSLSNRFQGKTDAFHAWFEAVRGGFVLHLQNKAASGIRYDLIRAR